MWGHFCLSLSIPWKFSIICISWTQKCSSTFKNVEFVEISFLKVLVYRRNWDFEIIFTNNTYLRKWLFTIDIRWQICTIPFYKLATKNKIDLILAFIPIGFNWEIVKYLKGSRIKYVFTVHDISPLWVQIKFLWK